METFEGLNVSSKFAICGLPIRIDSYKTCSFGCEYCFSNARKVMEFRKELQIANVSSIQNRLDRIYNGGKCVSFLDVMIKNGITWHCGGMSDPFQPIEKELGVTRDILDVTNKYGIHILFSTKSDSVYDANIDNKLHSFQLSISNVYNRSDIEPNVPNIDKRLKFFNMLKDAGFRVGVRIQPFIPNVSNLEIVKMFHNADHFTLEGIKIVPQNEEQKSFVREVLGLDLSSFTQMGLLNLKPSVRMRLYEPFIKYFNDNGISYSIADNDLRYLSNNRCCCGDSLVSKSTSFNVTSMIANYGRDYSLSDVLSECDASGCLECDVRGLFTSNRVGNCHSVSDFYKKRFYDKASPFSPMF